MVKASDNEFPSVLFGELGAAPTTPAAGKWRLYTKSDGLYVVDDAGAETGPLAVSGIPTFAGVRVTDASTQSVNTATWTSIEMDTEDYDTNGYHDTVTNNSRITIPAGKAGKYAIGGNLGWGGGSTTGRRGVRIFLNGTTEIAQHLVSPVATDGQGYCVVTYYNLAETDYVELQGFQSSGGALSTSRNGTSLPVFWASLIGT